MINSDIGNYHIISELAYGSFGRVYLARHSVFTNRVVALKLMQHSPLSSPQERKQFLDEARILELLHHPYILPILDAGIYDGLPYLVAEYAMNGSLRDQLLRRTPDLLPVEASLRILSQVGQALYFAHQQNIIHRDLKPENILFNARGDALLADFGLATMLASVSVKYVSNAGTPRYMAPEQFNSTVSKESDQYALGCIAYELFTGHRVFDADDPMSLMFKHVTEAPIPLSHYQPGIPEYIEHAVLKALAKQRHDRYADIKSFIMALHTPIAPSVSGLPTISMPGDDSPTQINLHPETQVDNMAGEQTGTTHSVLPAPEIIAQSATTSLNIPGLSNQISIPSLPSSQSTFTEIEQQQPAPSPFSSGPYTPVLPHYHSEGWQQTYISEQTFVKLPDNASSLSGQYSQSVHTSKRFPKHKLLLIIAATLIIFSAIAGSLALVPRLMHAPVVTNTKPKATASLTILPSPTSTIGASSSTSPKHTPTPMVKLTPRPTATPVIRFSPTPDPSPTPDTRPLLSVTPTNVATSSSDCNWSEYDPHGEGDWFCSITLSNNKHTTRSLNWNASSNASYLFFFDHSSGTLLPGQTDTISILVSSFSVACPTSANLIFSGPVNTVYGRWTCDVPIVESNKSGFNASNDCSYSNGWTCSIYIFASQASGHSVNWSSSSSGINGITFSPPTGTIISSEQIQVIIFVPNTSCPANATLNFIGPVNIWQVGWGC